MFLYIFFLLLRVSHMYVLNFGQIFVFFSHQLLFYHPTIFLLQFHMFFIFQINWVQLLMPVYAQLWDYLQEHREPPRNLISSGFFRKITSLPQNVSKYLLSRVWDFMILSTVCAGILVNFILCRTCTCRYSYCEFVSVQWSCYTWQILFSLHVQKSTTSILISLPYRVGAIIQISHLQMNTLKSLFLDMLRVSFVFSFILHMD